MRVNGVVKANYAAPPVEPEEEEPPQGIGTAELTGLTVAPVTDQPTQLSVSWDAVQGAARYDVRWKTGDGDYGDAVGTTANSYTVTGLTAGTSYTVNVAALDGDNTLLAEGAASGTTAARTGQSVEEPPANTPASGAPTISGTAQVGQTLTADTSGITDSDGLDNATFTYQWLADDAAISGATGSTYTPVEGDAGKAVRVRVSFTDDAGNAEALTSAATAAVAAADPPAATPAASFVVYHDPDAGAEAVDRYNQGVKLLKDAGISYSEVTGDVQADVDRLAGVSDSVLPRFFLGDPTEEGWTSGPGENNGGLRWLKEEVAAESSATANEPAGPAALEGLTVSPVSGETTRLAVSWNAVTGADQYLVKWKTGSADFNSGDEATTNSHTITGLTAGTAYTVQVTAIDTGADPDAELATGESSGVTLAAMGTVTVTAVADSSDSLDVSWPAVSGATGYAVEWKTGGGSYSAVTRSDATATSQRITGLAAETAYTVKVTARHTIGGAAAYGDSAEGSATTNAAPAEDPPANTPASGAPSISGTAQVGQELTADTSGISDADGLTGASFSYQWLADDAAISGATSGSYTPVAGDAGKAVKVRVSFTDDAGNAEALTSAATAAVAAADPPAETPAVSFVVYHDPDAGDEAVDRYNQGVKLLTDAGIAYSEVKGDVQAEVDRLAGVTDSVLPRFFLGDPTGDGWASKPRENNGGLRWLKEKVAELNED